MRRRTAQRPGRRPLVSLLRAALSLGFMVGSPCLLPLSPSIAHAQTVNDRVVQGKVELSNGTAVQNAIVYIKNAKTLEVRTYISTVDGSYRFAQLSTDADYSIWAEYKGSKSKERTISSFDNKKVFTILLRINS